MPAYREVTQELITLVNQGKTGKEISKLLNLDYSTVHAKLRKLNLKLKNGKNNIRFNEHVFDSIDTEEKAYWLGYIFADGYVNSKTNVFELCTKESDKSHLDEFNKFMQFKGNNVVISNTKCGDKTFKRVRWLICNKHLKNILCSYGCIPNKSLILKFPNINIFKQKKLIYDFIRGYVDGDGHLRLYSTKNKMSLDIEIIGTKEFLSKIVELTGIERNSYIKDRRRASSNTYTIKYGGEYALKLGDLLYKNATIYLKRKYDLYSLAVSQSNL